jgi:molybdenum cofactor synthesis domain-containing protein
MPDSNAEGLQAKVLTISDRVTDGTRIDESGPALAERLAQEGYELVERHVVADGRLNVEQALKSLALNYRGLIVTTGGTGFSPRDQTPEGTANAIAREAPGLAEAMRLANPLGRLSRGIAGVRGETLILNTPGSMRGALECLEAVMDVLPHALRLIADRPSEH